MAGWIDAIIVTLIAIGSDVVIGILGYLIEKKGAQEENGDR